MTSPSGGRWISRGAHPTSDLELIAEAPDLAHFLAANDDAIRKGVEYVGTARMRPDATLFSPFFGVSVETARRDHGIEVGDRG
jgi:hypothetical protein